MPKTTELNRTKERRHWIEWLQTCIKEAGEECLEYKGNGLCIPAVDENGNEYYVALTIAIPLGGRDGEKFDGYAAAQDYKLHQEEVAFKQEQRLAKTKQEAEERARRREALQAKKIAEEEKRLKIREAMIKAQMEEIK